MLKKNSMAAFIKTYGIALVVFTVIDLVWLGLIAKNFYRKYLGYIMKPSPDWTAAIVFYLIYLAGVVFFVINPAVAKHSWKFALFAGMFFGLVTYATYDLTNLATLKEWPVLITIMDLLWGTTLGGLVSLITYLVVTRTQI